MADQFPKVEPAELARFFKGVDAVSDCPFCGVNDWELPILNSASHPFGLVTLSTNGTMGRDFVPLLVMSCLTCGFMRLHATKVAADWLASNPKVSDG